MNAVAPDRPRHVVFLGPPGAGKGTQASELSTELGLAHLSTGDLLRAAVAQGTALGHEADGHMRAGRLVPDELVLRILGERLGQDDAAHGFLLDGFPRNPAQAEALERLARVDRVVWFALPRAALVERLAGRRVCPRCGSVYHVTARPPRTEGRCDRDGTVLAQRPDDQPAAVEMRLKVYAEQTAPLLEFYRGRGVLREVDAAGRPEEVGHRLRRLLGA